MVEGDEPKKEGLFLDGQLFPLLSFIAALSYILCLSWRREGMRGEGRHMTRTHHVGFRLSRCTGWSEWICPKKLGHSFFLSFICEEAKAMELNAIVYVVAPCTSNVD